MISILCSNYPDPALQRLARLAERRQAMAFRPGTRSNHRSVLTKFVRFCAGFNIDFASPSDETICMFFEHCLEHVKAPATIKNYSSTLASCYNQMGLDSSPFQAYRVKLALTSVDKNVRHIPEPSLPVSAVLLKKVIRVVNKLRDGPTVSCALIVMFHTFFRQSNLAAPTSLDFDATRQLVRSDVVVRDTLLQFSHKWSKSHQSASHHQHVIIPAVPGNILCPKQAVSLMLKAVPTRRPHQPFLSFQDGSHLPASYLRKVWNTVLRVLAIPNCERYSLHGLRRGGATHVFNQDPSARDAIKSHGLWKSNAVDRYLPDKHSKVFTLLRDTL